MLNHCIVKGEDLKNYNGEESEILMARDLDSLFMP